jgi:hypothetical protein
MANSTQQHDFVLFEALSWSAPIPKTASSEFLLHLLRCHIEPGGQAFNNDHKGLAMAFTCGQITQHTYRLPVAYAPTMAINERGYL